MQIELTSDFGLAAGELQRLLDGELRRRGVDVPLTAVSPELRLKGLDPTIISAAVGATSALLGTFVAALLRVLQARGGREIELSVGDVKVRVPVNATPAELEKAMACLRELEGARVLVSRA